MSNFACAVQLSPFSERQSTARADILAASPPHAAPTTAGSTEQCPQVRCELLGCTVEQLLAQKAKFQMKGDEQIVARFVIEQLQFHGIRNAAEAATCLAGYDKTRYPEGSGPSFTGFFLPKGFSAGLRLEHSGADLSSSYEASSSSSPASGRWRRQRVSILVKA